MEYGILIFVHVVASSLWAAVAFFYGAFLVPSIGEAGPAGGAVMGGLMKRKMPEFMTAMAVLGVLSGLRLYMLRFGVEGAGLAWVGTPEGIVITLGSLAGLHAFIKGLLVSKPMAEKAGALGAQIAQAQGKAAPELVAEMQALQAKMAKIARGSGFELLAAFLLMASHRLAVLF
jgi:hypothetical protein